MVEPYLDGRYLEMLGIRPEDVEQIKQVFTRMIAPTRRVVRSSM